MSSGWEAGREPPSRAGRAGGPLRRVEGHRNGRRETRKEGGRVCRTEEVPLPPEIDRDRAVL